MDKQQLIKKIRLMSKVLSAVLVIYLFFPIRDIISAFMAGWNDAAAEDAAGIEPAPMTTPELIIFFSFLAIAILIIAIVIMVFRVMNRLCTGESPFTLSNCRRIRNLSILMLTVGAIEFLSSVTVSFFEGYAGTSFFSGTTFITGTVMYCISLVFRYGCELQQESDETL